MFKEKFKDEYIDITADLTLEGDNETAAFFSKCFNLYRLQDEVNKHSYAHVDTPFISLKNYILILAKKLRVEEIFVEKFNDSVYFLSFVKCGVKFSEVSNSSLAAFITNDLSIVWKNMGDIVTPYAYVSTELFSEYKISQ